MNSEKYIGQSDNNKKYLMSLLYKQTKELHRFYNSPIEGKKNYYLLNKEWLDN